MSKALLVLAHPGKSSLSHLFAHSVRATLEPRGIDVEILDLYAEKFDPVLTQNERDAYYTITPSTTGISEQVSRLTQADMLILIFPTWWFGLPAILKGWLDRVFAPTIAFDHADSFGPLKPRLGNLNSVLVITTLGSPWWIDWLIMRRPVRRILKTAVFGLCAPQAKFKMLSIYSAEKMSGDQIEAANAHVKKLANQLR